MILRSGLEHFAISLIHQGLNGWKIRGQITPTTHSGQKPTQALAVPFARKPLPCGGSVQDGSDGGCSRYQVKFVLFQAVGTDESESVLKASVDLCHIGISEKESVLGYAVCAVVADKEE